MFADNYAEPKENGAVLSPNKEEKEDTMENEYKKYRELGGIINKGDYMSAILRAKDTVSTDEYLVKHAKMIARVAGISLDENDPRVVLYGILRNDKKPADKEPHHSSMSDQRIFVEALRMLKDEDALKKCIDSYPHISFNYEQGD